jgi:hypothetical protein
MEPIEWGLLAVGFLAGWAFIRRRIRRREVDEGDREG